MADSEINKINNLLNKEIKKFRPETINELAFYFNKLSPFEKHLEYINQGLTLKTLEEQNKILYKELTEALNHIYYCC